MADNVTAPGTGAVFAADDISGVLYPRTKVAFGADGAATDVSTAAPFPVTLAAADLAALETVTIVPPAVATTTREYVFASGVSLIAGASSSRTASGITASEIMLHNAGTVRAYIRTGSVSVNATVDALSIPLEPGEKFHKRITSGDYVAAIRDGASDATIRILPVA